MSVAAIRKAPTFNPKVYQNEFTQLAQENPAKAGEIAAKLQKFRLNLETEMGEGREAIEQVVEIGSASVGSLFVGWLDGGWEAKADKMVADWETSGYSEYMPAGASKEEFLKDYPKPWNHTEAKKSLKDPHKVFGFLDKTLGITLIFTAVAIAFGAVQGGRPSMAGAIFKSLALGQFSYFIGSVGRNAGYKREKTKIEAGTEA